MAAEGVWRRRGYDGGTEKSMTAGRRRRRQSGAQQFLGRDVSLPCSTAATCVPTSSAADEGETTVTAAKSYVGLATTSRAAPQCLDDDGALYFACRPKKLSTP